MNQSDKNHAEVILRIPGKILKHVGVEDDCSEIPEKIPEVPLYFKLGVFYNHVVEVVLGFSKELLKKKVEFIRD